MRTKDIGKHKIALDMWLKGMTFKDIGEEMGLTRQRIHAMLTPPTALRKQTYERAGGRCQECGVFLSHNGHYHSTDNGTIDDFTKPLKLLCQACHRKAHKGGVD